MKSYHQTFNFIVLFLIIVNAVSCTEKKRIQENGVEVQKNKIELLTDSCRYCSLLYNTIIGEDMSKWYAIQESLGQEYYVILKDNLLYDCSDYFSLLSLEIKLLSSADIINGNTKAYFDYKKIQIISDSAFITYDYPIRDILIHSKYKWEMNQWIHIQSSIDLYTPARADF